MEPTNNYRVFLITLCTSILYFTMGTAFGWTSPTMPKLREHTIDSPLENAVSISNEGWIGSLLTIGGLLASFFSGPLAGRIGRKPTLLLSSLFFSVSFILFIFGMKVWILCLGRFIQGLGAGLASSTVPIYIGEIAPDECRGALGTIYNLFLIGGIIYIYAIGPYVSYMSLQWYCLAIPVIFFFICFFMPESPYFLATKGRKVDGIKSLKSIRGQSMEAAKIEMNMIQKDVDESMSNTGTVFDIFCNRGYRRALIICCGLLIFQALSGTTAITFNCQTIFMSAESTIDPALASILLGIVQLLSSFLTPLFIERLGRKIILLISAVGICVALFALGTFFYVKTFDDASQILWIPVPALVLFCGAFAFGFGSIPWAVLGEIFPPNIKSIATSIATTSVWLMTFIVTRWYPEIDALGSYYSFWIFGSLTFVSIFFIIFVMIETKGLSLREIQDKLHSSKISMRNQKIYESVQTNTAGKI
ncbi:facilitated trehalose transporter Tret1-like isoform X1 [Eupeodes corollae]|uniref:facilitated trehalose transporter Tret1-like isoform X1 n=1 Tax=Eupeodes corollae TaxID=290404 RepID=UPI00249375D1|nr:facilitated trehalose transporter Tret1-like isoform X1 [Eupeodes corollae]